MNNETNKKGAAMQIHTTELNGVYHVYVLGKSRWQAKAAKRCTTVAERDAAIATFEAYIAEHEAAKVAKRAARSAERKALKATLGNPYKIGDILYASWGYDQTNIDFYEIVAVTARSVTFRKIAQTCEENGFMSGHTSPVPGSFVGEAERRNLQVYVGCKEAFVAFGHRTLYRHTAGQTHYCSWYA